MKRLIYSKDSLTAIYEAHRQTGNLSRCIAFGDRRIRLDKHKAFQKKDSNKELDNNSMNP